MDVTARERKRAYDKARYEAKKDEIKAKVRARYWADPEKVKAYEKRYREEHPDLVAERKRQYVQANRDKHNARNKRWKDANPDKVATTNRRWKQANPDKHRETERRRAALKRGSQVEKVDYRAICERDGWACQLCGEPVDATLRHPDPMSGSIDHIVPIIGGGAHSYANTQLAHLRCNISKGARHAA